MDNYVPALIAEGFLQISPSALLRVACFSQQGFIQKESFWGVGGGGTPGNGCGSIYYKQGGSLCLPPAVPDSVVLHHIHVTSYLLTCY